MSKVETPEEHKARETVEAIAENIVNLATGVHKIVDGRLNKKAIILLLASAAGGMPQETVTRVLDAIMNLDKKFLK